MTERNILSILVCLVAMSVHASPVVVPFQGQLRSAAGAVPADGPREILFRLYDQPSGGEPVWPGEVHTVSVVRGLVNVLLGTQEAFGEDFDFDRMLYIEITVDANGDRAITVADPPLLPRQRLSPVPFAVNARRAAHATHALKADKADATDVAASADTPVGQDLMLSTGGTTRITILAENGHTGVGVTQPTEMFEVAGKVKATAFEGDGSALTGVRSVPVGGIIMWSGAIDAIPAGWALCDGTNGTPDLRDRFIVGAGSSYTVAATGGEEKHILTQEEIPPHSHEYSHSCGRGMRNDYQQTATGESQCQGQTGSSGGGQPHENRPPYYALAYIMKVE